MLIFRVLGFMIHPLTCGECWVSERLRIVCSLGSVTAMCQAVHQLTKLLFASSAAALLSTAHSYTMNWHKNKRYSEKLHMFPVQFVAIFARTSNCTQNFFYFSRLLFSIKRTLKNL